MTMDASGEDHLRAEIDTIFQSVNYRNPLRGSVELAAFDLGDKVSYLDALKREQDAMHGSIESANFVDRTLAQLGFTGLFYPVSPEPHDDDYVDSLVGDEPDYEEIFTPIEKADLTLRASVEGIRTAYNLTRFQMWRAKRLSMGNSQEILPEK